jgi:hypothetical protein
MSRSLFSSQSFGPRRRGNLRARSPINSSRLSHDDRLYKDRRIEREYRRDSNRTRFNNTGNDYFKDQKQ